MDQQIIVSNAVYENNKDSKSCINCIYLNLNTIDRRDSNCKLHYDKGIPIRVTWPEWQFCGDEYFIDKKVTIRDEKITKILEK